MVKLMRGELRASDLIAVASSPTTRTGISYFGQGPRRYLGRAVAWKANPQAMPEGTKRGLAKASAMSQKYSIRNVGERARGVAVVRDTKRGRTVVIPMKCALQMDEAGSGQVVQTFRSAAMAYATFGSAMVQTA